ncbi:hypothetical protein RCL1_004400 [Eukaryota sp. TZLM3-RCL]
MTSSSNASEASIRIGPQGLSTPPPTLITDTTHEGSARPAEHPAPQDPSLVPSVSAVPSATVGNVSVPAEDEEDLPVPIYSPVPPFLEEELRGRSAQELLAEFEEPRPSSSLPSAKSEFATIPREWLMSLTELANQGVDIPSLLRSTDPVQVGASVAPVDVTHPSRSRPRGSSSVSSRIAHLSINPPEATTSSPQSSVTSSSSPSNSESTRFRVTPITSLSGPDLLGFVRQFASWSRHFNGDASFTPLSSENPVHDLDIIRAHLRGVNPTGVQDFVDPFIVDTWEHSGLLNPSGRDCDVWRTICLLSQLESRQQAIHALEDIKMDWTIRHPTERWSDYVFRFQRAVYRSTACGQLFNPNLNQGISLSFYRTTFVANLGILRIYYDLSSAIHSGERDRRLSEFIRLVGAAYFNWTRAFTYDQQLFNRLTDPNLQPSTSVWDLFPSRLANEAKEAQARLRARSHPTPIPPLPSMTSAHAMPRQRHQPPPAATPPSASGPVCSYCKQPGHAIESCPDPSCNRSKLRKSGDPPSGNRRDRNSKRGAPGHKKSNKDYKYPVFFMSNPSENIRKELTYKPLDAFQGPVLSPLIVGPTDVLDDGKPSGTNPRLVPSNVFLDPVPFRKGSRMAGSNVDLASNPTSKFGKSAINPFETSRSPFPFPLPRVRSDSILIPSNEVSNRSHSILSLTQTVSRPINSGSFLQLQILINDVSVTGTFDTAASCSVISKDLAMSCSMEFVTDSVEYLSANNVTTSSLGSARGVLTFRLGNIANLVRVSHSLPVTPGSNILLVGTDILTSLGLLNEDGVFIKLNREHSVILQDEAKFDHLIPITTADELSPDQISADFLTKLAESDCEITLDDPIKQTRLIKVLESFSEVFQSKPHPDGIDCPPMEIPFHSEDVVVKMKPRNLNPNKLRIARDIFTDLVNSGFAYFTKDSKFGSPIVLVTYPDHRKPRLTGDFSGATGVNANTKTVVPNLPKISDILEFLSSAQFIGTLDLPKAFWQLNVATKDQEKTTLVIPGMSIAFRRACFGLKNVPAIFQNIMMEIFDIPGIFIYIDDVIIADSSFDGFLDKIRTVLHRAKLKRVNLGLNKCRFSSSNHPVKILGHVFLNKTRFIDSSRIDALNDLPRPTTLKEVRSFIGSINYLRDWLPDISSLIAPIINLTKGSPKSISWTPALDNLFVKIKSMIANHIPLTLPDQEGNILISTDASDIAVGGVVWLERPPCAAAGTKLIDRKVLPLSFYSKILSNSQKNWSVFQKSFMLSF